MRIEQNRRDNASDAQRTRHRELLDTLHEGFVAALSEAVAGVSGLHMSTSGGLWLDWDGKGERGYWVYAGVAGEFDSPETCWPTFLNVNYVDEVDERETPAWAVARLDMKPCHAGPAARDPELLAVFAVGAVLLDHKRRERR